MRKLLVSTPVLAAALIVFASVAAAGVPATATGTFTATGAPTVTASRTAGGNTFITESFPVVYAGEITGPFVVAVTIHFRRNGSFTAHGTLLCTGCTIGGRTGDFTGVTALSGPSLANARGTVTVVSARGGLAGLHAHAQFATVSAASGNVTYHYHFEP
jgi:Protein of unknown function (DUF3224)